jgi:hypothetical protein
VPQHGHAGVRGCSCVCPPWGRRARRRRLRAIRGFADSARLPPPPPLPTTTHPLPGPLSPPPASARTSTCRA